MKRTSFDDKRDQRIADEHLEKHRPCSTCSASAHVEELSRLGSRCQACYDAYLAERNPAWWPNRPLTPDERKAVVRKATEGLKRIGATPRDPRAWARDLRDRELSHGGVLASGARMTDAQREAWRRALRFDAAEVEADPC